MSFEPTPNGALTSYTPSATKVSDDEQGEQLVDVMLEIEWIARVDIARQAVEILGKRLN